jgi:hypothetical protein
MSKRIHQVYAFVIVHLTTQNIFATTDFYKALQKMATVVGGARRLLCMPSPVIKWRNVYPVQLRALSTSPTLASSKIRPFDYTHAVVRKIPSSFADNYQKINAHKVKRGIQLARATEQLTKYIAILKICGVDVITLSAEEKYPDCVFVEDCAVIIGNKACITRPGHPSRRGEVRIILSMLSNVFIFILCSALSAIFQISPVTMERVASVNLPRYLSTALSVMTGIYQDIAVLSSSSSSSSLGMWISFSRHSPNW